MRARVDQLLFGYREGHELLAASTPIESRLQSVLLPHTDARFEDQSDHYLIGIPIPEANRYLLARIWPAPELPRPGAVWAHGFLLSLASLSSIDPIALEEHFRRPAKGDYDSYAVPLELSCEKEMSFDAPMHLMKTLCLVTYKDVSRRGGVVLWDEPVTAEAALLALWRGLPTQARTEFSFRTRGRARTGRSPYTVQVAAVLAGRSDSNVLSVVAPANVGHFPPWATVLAETSLDPSHRSAAFIAENAADVSDSRILASIWPSVLDSRPAEVLSELAANYPEPSQQTSLKLSLFGEKEQHGAWWKLTELDRLSVVLKLRSDFLRGPEFALPTRLDRQWRSARREQMLAWLDSRRDFPSDSAVLVLKAAIPHLNATEIASRVSDHELLTLALEQRTEILGKPEFWTQLRPAQAKGVVRLTGSRLSDPAVVSALLEADQDSVGVVALEHGADPLLVADTLARRYPTDISRFASVFSEHKQDLLIALQEGARIKPDTLVLAAGMFGPAEAERIPIRRWLAGARAAHDRSDAAALSASMTLLCAALGADGKTARKILIESFGPVHAGLETDAIDRSTASWKEFERCLPGRSSDRPSERLRQALLLDMEKNEWSTEELKRALEPAGPQAERLIRLVPKKSSLRRFVESTLGDLVSPLRN